MVWPLSGGWVSNKCGNVLEYEKQVSVFGSRILSQFEEVWVPRRTILALARKCRLIAHPQNPAVGLAAAIWAYMEARQSKNRRPHTSNQEGSHP